MPLRASKLPHAWTLLSQCSSKNWWCLQILRKDTTQYVDTNMTWKEKKEWQKRVVIEEYRCEKISPLRNCWRTCPKIFPSNSKGFVKRSIRSTVYSTFGPYLWSFNLWFFSFRMVWTWYSFSRNYTLNFDIFPQANDMGYNLLLWCWETAVSCSSQSATHHHEDEQLIQSQPFCTPSVFHVSLSVQYSIQYYLKYSTL